MIFCLITKNQCVCQYGHFIPKSRVSHISAPAGPLTYFHWHTVSTKLSCDRGPQIFCPPRSDPTVSCLHLDTLPSGQFRGHLQNVPNQSLHVSQPTQGLQAEISSIDITPESSSIFQDFIVFHKNVWCWACNFFKCILLVILFELFTKSLQTHPICFANFLPVLFNIALQSCFDSPTVCEKTRCFPNTFTRFRLHLLIVPSAHRSFHEVSGSFFCEFYSS